ncbi:MAG: hypothetical protein ACKVVP_10180 [Chloroflexota bacterium]
MRLHIPVILVGLLAGLIGFGTPSGKTEVLSVAPLPPVESRDPRFGIVQAGHSPQLAANAGASWERIIFPWSLIQKESPNEWNQFYFTDQQIRSQAARGMTQVGVLIYTPHWASPTPARGKPVDVPRNLNLPHDHPDNYWGQFVRKIVARHAGVVDHWIVWNEPDLYDPTIRYTFSGSYEEYLQLVKVAYLNVKEVNPRAKVIIGGMAYWWDREYNRTPYLLGLMEVLKTDRDREKHDNYFDILALHTYGNPLNSYAIPKLAKEWLDVRGLKKPIWINESNVVPYNDPVQPLPAVEMRATLDEQASYVIQSYALGIAAGVERHAIYKMLDEEPEGGQYYGLIRNDGSTRPAYTAYQVAASYFTNVTSAFYTWPGLPGPASTADIYRILDSVQTRPQFIWPAQVSQVVMERGDRRTTVLWNNSPAEVETSFSAASKNATLVTKYGQAFPIAARGDRYFITLHGSTNNSDERDRSIYLVGGEPVIVDEPVEPIPQRVRARIESVIPVDGKPVYESDQANVAAVLSLPGTNDPTPCRWEPDVQLWARTVSGRSVKLGSATRRTLNEQGLSYPVWDFNGINISTAMDPDGKRLVSLQIRIAEATTETDSWEFPSAPPPEPEVEPSATMTATAAPTVTPTPRPTPQPIPRILLAKSCG